MHLIRFQRWTLYLGFSTLSVLSSLFYIVLMHFNLKKEGVSVIVIRTATNSWVSDDDTACHIPSLDPYDASVLMYIGDAEPVNCTEKYLPLFFTDMESNLIFNDTFKKLLNLSDCCYKEILRVKADEFKFSSECYPVAAEKTKIPNTIDQIAVYCSAKLVGMFGFIHIKEENISKKEIAYDIDKSVNVVILGLDSMSHMNFLRTMPKTQAFLKNNLSAMSMNGLTKVGMNAYEIIPPLLMGLTWEEAEDCVAKTDGTFDDCPFIWKLYSSLGYKTVLSEDGNVGGGRIFKNMYKEGFHQPPTDYYQQSLFNAMNSLLGHGNFNNSNCYGSRLALECVLDTFRKAAYTFNKSKDKYFQFGWSNILGHDSLNLPKLGDEPILELLKWLHSGNYFWKTVFILMSDNGLLHGPMRANTYQGRIEDNMPFMYTVFPEWMIRMYPLALENFRSNSQRLSTHYDIQETLTDLASLERIDDEQIRQRSEELASFDWSIPSSEYRGISLFLLIPNFRTCQHALIHSQYCICHTLHSVSIKNYMEVAPMGEAVVLAINELLANSSQLCAKLTLLNVTRLQTSVPESTDREPIEKEVNVEYRSALINIITSPGNASFEAMISKDADESWTVDDPMTISRTNKYYDREIDCVATNHDLSVPKEFCYCKNQI